MNKPRRTGYAFTLLFVREFTHGTCLVGTTHEDSLGFCRREDAEDWVSGINEKNARDLARNGAGERYVPGQLTYRVKSYSVVENDLGENAGVA